MISLNSEFKTLMRKARNNFNRPGGLKNCGELIHAATSWLQHQRPGMSMLEAYTITLKVAHQVGFNIEPTGVYEPTLTEAQQSEWKAWISRPTVLTAAQEQEWRKIKSIVLKENDKKCITV